MKVLVEKKADFFILGDVNINEESEKNKEKALMILDYIRSSKKVLEIIDFSEIAMIIKDDIVKIIKDGKINCIILVGNGGKLLFMELDKIIKIKSIEKVSFMIQKRWNGADKQIIESNINGKNILLLDDVLATGETIRNALIEIEKKGGIVKGIVVGVMSENYKGSEPISVAGYKLCDKGSVKKSIEPFWFPPIYSIRHLLNKENEMPNFAEIFAEKYFDGDMKVIKMIND